MPVPTIFRFIPNFEDPDDLFPHPVEYFLGVFSKAKLFVYLGFSILYNLANSFGFLVANLVIDINVVKNLRRTLQDKAKRMSKLTFSNTSSDEK